MNTKILTEQKAKYPEAEIDIGDHLIPEFESLLESKNFYPYHKDVTDSLLPEWKWNGYGDFSKGLLWMVISKGDKRYIGRLKSRVLWPAMIDRMFGMDVDDAEYTGWLSDLIGEVYKEELI